MKINRTGIFPSKTLIGNYVQWCKRSCTYKSKTESRTRLKKRHHPPATGCVGFN